MPVREEPRHKPVLQNYYFRLLDVWLPPGDTTMFHIHATPSLFVILESARTRSQIQGQEWRDDRYAESQVWYRSFADESLVHRVLNADSKPFHVNDIEILNRFDSARGLTPLPFPVLFENDKAVAYRVDELPDRSATFIQRGPIILELVAGSDVSFHDAVSTIAMEAGKYLYIPPDSRFYFSAKSYSRVNMVIFELK